MQWGKGEVSPQKAFNEGSPLRATLSVWSDDEHTANATACSEASQKAIGLEEDWTRHRCRGRGDHYGRNWREAGRLAMAHIQNVQTGLTVVTHLHGRVYRQQPGRKREHTTASRTQANAIQHRRICLLSARDARWLEEYAISQPCFGGGCGHSHHTRREVERMVKAGILRWVGAGMNVATYPEDYRWISRRSGGFAAMQLVDMRRMPDRKHLARIMQNPQNEASTSL